MKKLMIAAAIVCAAAFAQAAAYEWAGEIYMQDENSAVCKGTLEFFWNGVAITDGLLTIGDDGMVSFDFVGLNGPADGEATELATAKILATVTNFNGGNETGTLEWSQTFNGLEMQQAGGQAAHSTALAMDANVALVNEGVFDLSKSAAENGYTAVPEPTSGLLLLLGVAGLALRRRRA